MGCKHPDRPHYQPVEAESKAVADRLALASANVDVSSVPCCGLAVLLYETYYIPPKPKT